MTLAIPSVTHVTKHVPVHPMTPVAPVGPVFEITLAENELPAIWKEDISRHLWPVHFAPMIEPAQMRNVQIQEDEPLDFLG